MKRLLPLLIILTIVIVTGVILVWRQKSPSADVNYACQAAPQPPYLCVDGGITIHQTGDSKASARNPQFKSFQADQASSHDAIHFTNLPIVPTQAATVYRVLVSRVGVPNYCAQVVLKKMDNFKNDVTIPSQFIALPPDYGGFYPNIQNVHPVQVIVADADGNVKAMTSNPSNPYILKPGRYTFQIVDTEVKKGDTLMVPEFAWPMPVTIEANTIFDQTVPFVPVGTKLDAADQPPLTQMDTCLGQNGS